jgi:hypothetical protein
MLHASVPWLAATLPAGALCVTCVTCRGLGQCVCEHGLVAIAVSAAGCQTTAGQSVPVHHCVLSQVRPLSLCSCCLCVVGTEGGSSWTYH